MAINGIPIKKVLKLFLRLLFSFLKLSSSFHNLKTAPNTIVRKGMTIKITISNITNPKITDIISEKSIIHL